MGTISWDQLFEVIDKFPERVLDIGADTLTRIGYGILARGQDLVPFDTGALFDSGEVSEPEGVLGSYVSIEIGFGNEKVNYAIIQHENLEYKHPNGGQAKFLEQPCMEQAPYIEADLADALDNIFEI